MHVIVFISCLALAATQQPADDEWIDPYDMLNYDSGTKAMRKPAEPSNYPNVPTKRREYSEVSGELSSCKTSLELLEKQSEHQQKKIASLSQQSSCNPVFKRFLNRLLKEIERVGLPSDSSDVFYDAKIRVSRQTMTEMKSLLDGEESWRTGALDNAISQILTDLKTHDYEAWPKWRFEDTFGVDLDTVIKIVLCILMIVAVIATQLWSTVSWFVQFKRIFAVCFLISIVWNWFYLYKIAFAEHQNNLVKMDDANQKCTGVRKIDWSDSLKEWFRSTWTLQDDPCKQYYEVLMVNPILLVPPTKAISVTITTFITEPLKHFGQGISEFLRALLKDLPVQLQIPVLLTIVFSVLVVMYGGVHAAFQHGIAAPFRRHRRDPHDQIEPPPERYLPRIEGAGDPPPPQQGWHGNGDENQVRRRPVNRGRAQERKITVQNLGNVDVCDGHSDSEQTPNQQPVEPEGNVSVEQAKVKRPPAKEKVSLGMKSPDDNRQTERAGAPPNCEAEETASMIEKPQMRKDEMQQTPNTTPDVDLQTCLRNIESIGHPVQETAQ